MVEHQQGRLVEHGARQGKAGAIGQRERLASTVSGHLLGGVSRPVLARALEYWRKVDKNLGDRVAVIVNGG